MSRTTRYWSVEPGSEADKLLRGWMDDAREWLNRAGGMAEAAFGKGTEYGHAGYANLAARVAEGTRPPRGWRISKKRGHWSYGMALLNGRTREGRAMQEQLDKTRPLAGYALRFRLFGDRVMPNGRLPTPGFRILDGRVVLSMTVYDEEREGLPDPEGCTPMKASEYWRLVEADEDGAGSDAA